jgi:hypothetical protein
MCFSSYTCNLGRTVSPADFTDARWVSVMEAVLIDYHSDRPHHE